MLIPRIIPVLLVKGTGLYKGEKFRDHKYVGDPLNITQIFNAKFADELMVLDISATRESRCVSTELVQSLSDQCLMPFTVGGGIRSLEQVRDLLAAGAEKVCLGTAAYENPKLITDIANRFGSQSVVVSVDYKKNWLGQKTVYVRGGEKSAGRGVIDFIRSSVERGAGEILLTSIDHEGLRSGVDLSTLKEAVESTKVPVIVGSGVGSLQDIQSAIAAKADAVAAGAFFIYHGPRKAVLVNYPSKSEMRTLRSE